MSRTHRLPASLALALSALLGAVLMLAPTHGAPIVKLPSAGAAADPSPADDHPRCC